MELKLENLEATSRVSKDFFIPFQFQIGVRFVGRFRIYDVK